jgi:hypothetical protein
MDNPSDSSEEGDNSNDNHDIVHAGASHRRGGWEEKDDGRDEEKREGPEVNGEAGAAERPCVPVRFWAEG